ncbi:hypothetical protein BGE01nite_16320 [Brevifollis gellanilyticus]|uniref:Uncharacterized protein n=1 Tax=Brevifollis gellanilyticus TaxID=748831 RepID=A0A512M7M0_9BACT|nr:hypothetical protein BGE01nite_16320 [Brevifollis gellanilyticus]
MEESGHVFSFTASVRAIADCHDIIDYMVNEFGISPSEALARLNRSFAGWGHIGDHHIFFHEDEAYWANNIYYGKSSGWWQKARSELTPLPFP